MVQNVNFSGGKYRVAWEVFRTSYKGHGQPITEKLARDIVSSQNRKYAGEMNHWVEKAVKGAGIQNGRFKAIG